MMTTYEKLTEALQDLDLTDAKHYGAQMERENAKLREESAQKTAWINDIFRRLGLPSGDMGALENYILPNARDDRQLPGSSTPESTKDLNG